MINSNNIHGVELQDYSDKNSLNWFISNFLTAERGYVSAQTNPFKFGHTDLWAMRKNGNKVGFEVKRRIFLSTHFGDNICTKDKITDSQRFDEYFLVTLYADGKLFCNDLKNEEPFAIDVKLTPKSQETPEKRTIPQWRTIYHFRQGKPLEFAVSELFTPFEVSAAAGKYAEKVWRESRTAAPVFTQI